MIEITEQKRITVKEPQRRSLLRDISATGLGLFSLSALLATKKAAASEVLEKTVTHISNIAELRQTIPLYDGQQFELLGYTEKGKGGGHIYYDAADTSSHDNHVTVFVNGNHRFKRSLNKAITVFDAGALAYGDDTIAIQRALDVALDVHFGGSEYVFEVHNTLSLRNGHNLIFDGAKVIQKAQQKSIFNCCHKKNVKFYNGFFEGVGNDYIDTSSSMARGISGDCVEDCIISGCHFLNFSYSGFCGFNVKNFIFTNNTCSAIGVPLQVGLSRNNTGLTVGGENIIICGNNISKTAQGLIIAETSSVITITGNNIRDTQVEHGMYCDSGISCMTISNNSLRNCYQNGIKVQWYDAAGSEPHSITISGNTIDGTVIGDGILFNNTAVNSNSFHARSVAITGNSIRNAGQDGINARYLKNALVKDNLIDGAGRAGLYISQCINTTFSNSISNTQENGIFEDGTSSSIKLINNEIMASGLAGNHINGLSSGIFSAGSEFLAVRNNIVIGNSTTMQYALYIAAGDQGKMVVCDNDLSGALEYGARFKSPLQEFKILRNNYLSGNGGVNIGANIPPSN